MVPSSPTRPPPPTPRQAVTTTTTTSRSPEPHPFATSAPPACGLQFQSVLTTGGPVISSAPTTLPPCCSPTRSSRFGLKKYLGDSASKSCGFLQSHSFISFDLQVEMRLYISKRFVSPFTIFLIRFGYISIIKGAFTMRIVLVYLRQN
uniref:Uncharacterized protein n=1 Tax=Setaria italica TaxID=4555 RepID=K3YK22_SETIT